jgi:hypothetical protein
MKNRSITTNMLAGARTSLEMQLGLPTTFQPNITLNYLRNVAADIQPTGYSINYYYGIGTKGEYSINDGNTTELYIPTPYELNAYNQIPFRIVPVEEDLSDVERSQYRIRELRNINGQYYFIYWLKVLTINIDSLETNKITASGTIEPFDLDSTMLQPIPRTLSSSQGAMITETYNATCTATLDIKATEIFEVINTLYNNEIDSKISEICIFNGQDRIIQGPDGNNINNMINYTDAINCKIVEKTCMKSYPFIDIEDRFTRTITIGNGKAMIKM